MHRDRKGINNEIMRLKTFNGNDKKDIFIIKF